MFGRQRTDPFQGNDPGSGVAKIARHVALFEKPLATTCNPKPDRPSRYMIRQFGSPAAHRESDCAFMPRGPTTFGGFAECLATRPAGEPPIGLVGIIPGKRAATHPISVATMTAQHRDCVLGVIDRLREPARASVARNARGEVATAYLRDIGKFLCKGAPIVGRQAIGEGLIRASHEQRDVGGRDGRDGRWRRRWWGTGCAARRRCPQDQVRSEPSVWLRFAARVKVARVVDARIGVVRGGVLGFGLP